MCNKDQIKKDSILNKSFSCCIDKYNNNKMHAICINKLEN